MMCGILVKVKKLNQNLKFYNSYKEEAIKEANHQAKSCTIKDGKLYRKKLKR